MYSNFLAGFPRTRARRTVKTPTSDNPSSRDSRRLSFQRWLDCSASDRLRARPKGAPGRERPQPATPEAL
eukprot:5861909-Alexandrium_andersonii.AAC.1